MVPKVFDLLYIKPMDLEITFLFILFLTKKPKSFAFVQQTHVFLMIIMIINGQQKYSNMGHSKKNAELYNASIVFQIYLMVFQKTNMTLPTLLHLSEKI